MHGPSTTREAVPMPPFHSQQIMPVPAPTAPSATGPAVAPSTAARTSSAEIWVRRASLSQESSHSPTMGMVTTSRPTDGSSSASSSTTASQARPTCIVDVSRIGVSSTPHSRTWIAEVSSPAPLSTATPAARPLRTTSPSGPGTMAVTPVRATPRPTGGSGSSRQTVVWPTRTPGTSVMALPGPGGSRPISMPRSRARARGVGAGIGRTVPSRPPGASGAGASRPCDAAAPDPCGGGVAVPCGAVGELRMPVVWAPATDAHRVDTGVWCGVTIENDELPERAHVLLDACRAAGRADRARSGPRPGSAGGRPRLGVPRRAADRARALGGRRPPGRPGRAVRGRVLVPGASPGVTAATRPGRPRRSGPSSVATPWTP